MKIRSILFAAGFCLTFAQGSTAHQHGECSDPAEPLLSVADFNGDGVVSGKDIRMVARNNGKKGYAAIFDRDADGDVDGNDVALAAHDMGAASSELDQWLAAQYHRFSHLQGLSGHTTLAAMGYEQLGGPLKGHGVHWMNEAGMLAIGGLREADPTIAEGLNVTEDGSDIPALFWGEAAVPLFNDPNAPGGLSTLDYPAPFGLWNLERVQAFGDSPPDFIPGVDENWHTHAGTCLTVDDLGNGPEWITNQYMSNVECQALPNMAPFKHPITGELINLWGNFWMIHVWLFDLNPNGVFANTHPCISPTAPDEDTINDGREIPPWFQSHGGHS